MRLVLSAVAALLLAQPLAAQSGVISTVLGAYPLGDGLPAPRASLLPVHSLAIDNAGRLLLTEPNRLRRVESDGVVNTTPATGFSRFRRRSLAAGLRRRLLNREKASASPRWTRPKRPARSMATPIHPGVAVRGKWRKARSSIGSILLTK